MVTSNQPTEAKRLLSALATSYGCRPTTRRYGTVDMRQAISGTLGGRLRYEEFEGLSEADHQAVEQAWLGMGWAFQTGRLRGAVEREIERLSAYRLIALLAEMAAAGISQNEVPRFLNGRFAGVSA